MELRCTVLDPIRKVLVCPADVSPSRDDFEVIGAFNPGVATVDGQLVLLVRVAERPSQRRPGFTGLPRWDTNRGMLVDWVANDQLEFIDPRVVRCKSDGRIRLQFISHLKVVTGFDDVDVPVCDGAVFDSNSPLEEFGVEDPRITVLGGRFYITYVAVSHHGVATGLASTEDFITFIRHGIIFGPENKDIVLFPEKIDGQYVALHRPSGSAGFCRPEIWMARSPDLLHWGQHEHLLSGGTAWDSGRIGAGPPPLKTAEGWLVIYHGVGRSDRVGAVGSYSAGAVLLDHDDPSRVLRRSTSPLFSPLTDFQCHGFVPNVVFPTGIVAEDRSLLIYYGAADTVSAVMRISIDEVLASMHS
jgi:predicted GH43/DUF377 family glycosyl hydrolase